jgi:hypothetical protein
MYLFVSITRKMVLSISPVSLLQKPNNRPDIRKPMPLYSGNMNKLVNFHSSISVKQPHKLL